VTAKTYTLPIAIADIDALAEAMRRNRITNLSVGDLSLAMHLPPEPNEPISDAAARAITTGRKPMSREDLIAWATGEELPSERAEREAREAARRSGAEHTARPVPPPRKGGK
jgi:hypothetical protein